MFNIKLGLDIGSPMNLIEALKCGMDVSFTCHLAYRGEAHRSADRPAALATNQSRRKSISPITLRRCILVSSRRAMPSL